LASRIAVDNFKENKSRTPAGNRNTTPQFTRNIISSLDDLWSLLMRLLASF